MRTYEGVWKQLLESKKKTLRVHCNMPIERFVKAVFKEKDLDVENREKWKLKVHRFYKDGIVILSLRKKHSNYEV